MKTQIVLPPAKLNFPFFCVSVFQCEVLQSSLLSMLLCTVNALDLVIQYLLVYRIIVNCIVNNSFNLAYFGLLSVVISFLASDVILFCLQHIMVPTWPGLPRRGVITSKALDKGSINQKTVLEWHSVEATVTFNLIKLNPISHKTLNPLDADFNQDLLPIVLAHR